MLASPLNLQRGQIAIRINGKRCFPVAAATTTESTGTDVHQPFQATHLRHEHQQKAAGAVLSQIVDEKEKTVVTHSSKTFSPPKETTV